MKITIIIPDSAFKNVKPAEEARIASRYVKAVAGQVYYDWDHGKVAIDNDGVTADWEIEESNG